MRKQSIKSHLKEYSILSKRLTTINHAFASAIAPNDHYDEEKVDKAIKMLRQKPSGNLLCFYCDEPAETWDHIYGLVKDYKYYGYGHVVGNLLPSCKKCNSEKGNLNWEIFINKKVSNPNARKRKISILKEYLRNFLPKRYGHKEIVSICCTEMKRYEKIKQDIIEKMGKADLVARRIRNKIKKIYSKDGKKSI